MDASINSGKQGFESVKTFSKQLVDAFDVSGAGTRVAVISYDDRAAVNFGFNAAGHNSKRAIKNSIDRVSYTGGLKADASKALQLALDKVYQFKNGMRSGSNKVSELI